MTYQEKLLDPRWQKKRLRILERDDFKCRHCYDTKKTLHVHHEYYENSKEPWDYDEFSLITLCCDCHKKETEWDKKINYIIAKKFTSGIRDPFVKQCAIDVLDTYDIHELVYALWEMRKDHERVMRIINLADQSPWQEGFSKVLNDNL